MHGNKDAATFRTFICRERQLRENATRSQRGPYNAGRFRTRGSKAQYTPTIRTHSCHLPVKYRSHYVLSRALTSMS